MRALAPMPASVIDPATRTPLAGSFRGGLPAVDLTPLGKSPLFRLAHHKRWVYVAIAADELFIGLAAVHLGYAVTSFAFAFDRRTGKMAADRSQLALPFMGHVGDSGGEGLTARVNVPFLYSLDIKRARGDLAFRVDLKTPDLEIHARLSAEGAPPAIGAVAELGGRGSGLMNATEKSALLAVTGEATLAGKRRLLDGALGGYDYTQGYLARATTWRWAYLLGKAKSGERVGLNMVQGFVGEPECALWIDGEIFPLPEARFTFDADRPLASWRIHTDDGTVDLTFEPGGLHAEHMNLGVIKSRFIQPVGSFSGTIRVVGRAPIELERVLGVVEDQEVLW